MSTTVFFIRHAEKLHWQAGLEPSPNAMDLYVDNHLLSPRGCERAYALAGYFLHRDDIRVHFEARPLRALITQEVDAGPHPWGESHRPRQTLEPLRMALDSSLSLDDGIKDASSRIASSGPVEWRLVLKKDMDVMVKDILDGKYAGSSVIISWSHQTIADLCHKLGASSGQVPKKWPKKRFDLTWLLEVSHKGLDTTFKQLPQRLLYNDDPEEIQ